MNLPASGPCAEKNPIRRVYAHLTGGFSAFKGFVEARKTTQKPVVVFNTSNPWLYVFGGLATVGVGLLNWFYPQLGALGTVVFIVGSFYNAWFGAAWKDWRFWTLNAYVIAACTLVIMSFRK